MSRAEARITARWAALSVAGVILGSGCSSPSPGGSLADASDDALLGDAPSGDASAPTYAPTYSAVYEEVLSPNCAISFCHGGDTDFLQLSSESGGYGSLVNAPAAGPDCAPTGLKRVDPGHPETSLLYLKLTHPPCGSLMPRGYSAGLDPKQIAQIENWITLGALDD
ncbi:MAG: hypothetical protein ACREJ3_15180 [Polyangiaceae bacterium]